MKVLFIGDIVGKIGRKAIAKLLPKIKKEYKPDLVIANAENSAHGSGVTENIVRELSDYGIDYMTTGDHAFRKNDKTDVYDKLNIIRPANFSPEVPGKGHAIIKVGKHNILLINLIGRVMMKLDHDCPFRKLDEILAKNNLHEKNLSAIIVDIHAETTSEKICLGLYTDGRVTAVIGSHTHIMTADPQITKKGTAYITDVGMTGFADGSLGIEKDGIIKTFLTQIKYPHVIPEKGQAILNAVLINFNPKTGKAKSIKPIIKFINIQK